ENLLVSFAVEPFLGPSRNLRVCPVIAIQGNRIFAVGFLHVREDAIEKPLNAVSHFESVDRTKLLVISSEDYMPVFAQKQEIGCRGRHRNLRCFVDHEEIEPPGYWSPITRNSLCESPKLHPSATNHHTFCTFMHGSSQNACCRCRANNVFDAFIERRLRRLAAQARNAHIAGRLAQDRGASPVDQVRDFSQDVVDGVVIARADSDRDRFTALPCVFYPPQNDASQHGCLRSEEHT